MHDLRVIFYKLNYMSDNLRPNSTSKKWHLPSELKPDAFSDRAKQAESDLCTTLDFLEVLIKKMPNVQLRNKIKVHLKRYQ